MKRKIIFLASFTLLFVGREALPKLRKWNAKMQELGTTFSDLLPDLASNQPETAASRKRLEANAKKLSELAHTINMGADVKGGNALPPEADPTIGFVSGLFERQIKLAYHAIKIGHTEYGKAMLRNVSGYCISCHTRHDRGPDFPSINLSPKTASLTTMEKGELLAATRQFDAAFEAFESIVGDAKIASDRQLEWGRAVRHSLTIAIRVKRDPDLAISVMDKISKLPKLPGFYVENIPNWKKSVLEWKSDTAKKETSEETLYQEASRLSRAAAEVQEYPLDHSADVLYLRASVVLHQLLTLYPDGKRTAEALYLTGDAYDLLEERLISPLPNLYYETCIRKSPHSTIATKCFKRYEQNVLFGYSGSGGTSVPDDVQKLVEELGALAKAGKKI